MHNSILLFSTLFDKHALVLYHRVCFKIHQSDFFHGLKVYHGQLNPLMEHDVDPVHDVDGVSYLSRTTDELSGRERGNQNWCLEHAPHPS